MTDDTINKDDRCLAILALSLQKHKVDIDAGPIPSDEELNALHDANAKHSEHRHQQILQHITQDKTVYQRWLNIIDENHGMHGNSAKATADITSSSQAATAKAEGIARHPNMATSTSHTKAWQEKILSWIGNWFKPITFAGSGIAVAAVFSLFIFNPSFTELYDKEIDALYAQNSYTANDLLNLKLPTRSSNWQKDSIIYTPTQLTIAQGMQQGLQDLGGELSDVGSQNLQRIETNTVGSTSDVSKKDKAALSSLGRLTALTHIQCLSNNDNAQFFQQALPLYQQLRPQLSNIDEKTLSVMNNIEQQNIDANKKLCLTANIITEQLHIQY